MTTLPLGPLHPLRPLRSAPFALALLAATAPAARAQADSASTATAGAHGFVFRSGDGAFQLRVRGLLQADARVVGNAPPAATTFLIRRGRPFLEATIYRVLDVRLVPDFGLNAAVVQDANIDLHAQPWLVLRAGKFKPPIGLERTQPVADITFVERSLVSNLSPSRDVGFEVLGDAHGALSYALGVFNGALDNGVLDVDNGSQKDVDARVFALPFHSMPGALRGLGAGIGFSAGTQLGSASSPALPSYRTPAQVPVFSYASDGTAAGTTVAHGTRQRLAPQAYWYDGPVGVMAEYARETQDVRRAATQATLTHSAWSVTGNLVLSGERATFRGVTPAHPYGTGGRGAFEIGARVSGLALDDATFPAFADSTTSVRAANTVGAVFTWYLAPETRTSLELDDTRFTAGRAAGSRPDERAALVRVQLAF